MNSKRDSAEQLLSIKHHEENLFTSRGNFFVVAQSMLFAGVAAMIGEDHPKSPANFQIFCLLGLLLIGFLHCHFTRATVGKTPAGGRGGTKTPRVVSK